MFFEQLQLPQPKHNLDVGSGNHVEQTGRIMAGLDLNKREFRLPVAFPGAFSNPEDGEELRTSDFCSTASGPLSRRGIL